MKTAFDESLVDRTWPRKETRSLNMCQQKLPKLKNKEKKNPEENIQELWDNYKRCSVHVLRMPEEDRKKQKKYQK